MIIKTIEFVECQLSNMGSSRHDIQAAALLGSRSVKFLIFNMKKSHHQR